MYLPQPHSPSPPALHMASPAHGTPTDPPHHVCVQVKNVARCWTYETGVLLGKDEGMCDEMPPNEYYEYFGPDYRLQVGARGGDLLAV